MKSIESGAQTCGEARLLAEKQVIDFHIHPYQRFEEYMGVYGEDFFLPPSAMRADLEAAGIGLACGSVLFRGRRGAVKNFDEIRALNRAARELKALHKDFYEPGIHIHPAFPEESAREIEAAHRDGIRLIGELVPYLHGWEADGHDYTSAALSELLSLAERLGMIVSFHTMPEWPEQTEKMVAAHPSLTFVAAHPGQREDFEKHVGRMKKYPNLLLDLSGTGLFRYGLLAAAVKAVGSERILFGTDFPICNPRMYVQAVLGEHISDADKEKILFGNARRLLAAAVSELLPENKESETAL